jgi:hypothetical protein
VWIKNSPEYTKHLEDLADKKKKDLENKALEDKGKDAEIAKASDDVKTSIINEDIDDAIAAIEGAQDETIGITGVGSLLGYLPWESRSKTLAGDLSAIKTSIGFAGLQAMRASSPTGGALGSVSEGEHAMLQRLEGTLDQSGDDQTLLHNLRRIKVGRQLIVDGVYDPSSPKAASNGYRPPTPKEIDAAMAAIPKDLPPESSGRKSGGGGAKIIGKRPAVPTTP